MLTDELAIDAPAGISLERRLCCSCVFWEPDKDEREWHRGDMFICRRSTPSSHWSEHLNDELMWPMTVAGDWCGEWTFCGLVPVTRDTINDEQENQT